jgi:hypothetical protein
MRKNEFDYWVALYQTNSTYTANILNIVTNLIIHAQEIQLYYFVSDIFNARLYDNILS